MATISLTIALVARSQTPGPASVVKAATLRDVSPMLAELIAQHELPGMAALVMQDTLTVARGAAGVRERGRPEAVTISDQFHLGSVTKSMTATLCAMLVEEGKLRWDLTLAKALPDLKDTLQPEFRDVTVAQLLQQRTGIGERVGRTEIWDKFIGHPGTLCEARLACARDVLTEKPETLPGSQFWYSNYNYLVAGAIVESATGQPLGATDQRAIICAVGHEQRRLRLARYRRRGGSATGT